MKFARQPTLLTTFTFYFTYFEHVPFADMVTDYHMLCVCVCVCVCVLQEVPLLKREVLRPWQGLAGIAYGCRPCVSYMSVYDFNNNFYLEFV